MLGPIDYVYFWTADMDRAVEFYQRVLGLRLLRRESSTWAEFGGGEIRLALHGVAEGQTVETGGATVVFRVDDLDASRAALEERGAMFEEHAGEVDGFARFGTLRDPDGNRVDIIEYMRRGEA